MEKEFYRILSKDPTPGVKNRIERISKKKLKFPGWIFDSPNDLELGGQGFVKYFNDKNLDKGIVYSILQLGIKDFNNYPKCPCCGKVLKLNTWSRGFPSTCGDSKCISMNSSNKVKELWKDTEYRDTQSQSHKEWASKEENIEKMRQCSFKNWEDDDYRRKQTESHKEWSSKEENKKKMSSIAKQLWERDEYRELQVKVHKEFAINNPDKIACGNRSKEICSKSLDGFIMCDSSWESMFIEVCDSFDEIVSIERSLLKISYLDNNGNKRNYFPDFIITFKNNKTLLVEIKANWMIESDSKENNTINKISAGKEFVENSKEIDHYTVITEDILFNGSKTPTKKFLNREYIKEILYSYIN